VVFDDVQEDRVDVSLETAAFVVLLLVGFLELEKRGELVEALNGTSNLMDEKTLKMKQRKTIEITTEGLSIVQCEKQSKSVKTFAQILLGFNHEKC
jgi:hypothetical protein